MTNQRFSVVGPWGQLRSLFRADGCQRTELDIRGHILAESPVITPADVNIETIFCL